MGKLGISAAALCMGAAAVLSTPVANAQTSYWTGDFAITGLYVAGQNNFQYRTYGMGTQAMCPSSPNWAYINDSDSGSKGMVATILAAFYSGRTIRVLIAAPQGYCKIEEVFANP
jgi:hypothetical protein